MGMGSRESRQAHTVTIFRWDLASNRLLFYTGMHKRSWYIHATDRKKLSARTY